MPEEQTQNGHTYIVGASGSGKSTELIRRALKDISESRCVIFIDPHGEDIDKLLLHFPKSHPGIKDEERYKDIVVFDPASYPIAWNPLASFSSDATTATAVFDTFRSAAGFGNFSTPDFDETIYNAAAAMIEYGGSILGMKQMLTSVEFRKKVVPKLKDPIVASFWHDLEVMTDKEKREKTKSALSRLRFLLSDPRIRHCVGLNKNDLDLRDIVSEGRVLLFKLPIAAFGVNKVRTVGQLFLAQVHAAALAVGKPCSVYIDEVHYFAGDAFAQMLSGVRKYGVSLTFAHQYLDQLSSEVLSAVLGNVETTILYRVGIEDAQRLERSYPHDGNNDPLHELLPHHARIIRSGDDPKKCAPVAMEPIAGAVNTALAKRLVSRSRGIYGSREDHAALAIDEFLKAN